MRLLMQICCSLSLTYIQWGVLPVDMVIDVGHSQWLNRCGSNAQQNLGPDQQEVHHVGVGPVATLKPRVSVFWPGVVGADIPAVFSVPRVPGLVLVLMSQELRQGWQQCPQRHNNPTAANQAGSVGLGAEVADKQDEGQVADFKTAGNDTDIGTLQVEASLQSGQNTYLTETETCTMLWRAFTNTKQPFWVSVSWVHLF